jgi:hypothetical protein
MTNTNPARVKLNAKVAGMSTDQLIQVAMLLSRAANTEQTIVRVAVLSEYERREGGAAVDTLMDAMEAA